MEKIINVNGKKLNISQAIDLAVKYQQEIDIISINLRNICYEQIKPLLKEHKYKKAKKAVKIFFKEDIFIDKDLLLAHINRLIANYEK